MPTFSFLTRIPGSVLSAIIRRERITALHNRFVHIFLGILVAGSVAATYFSARTAAIPFSILLLFLYVVPLFGLLVGVSAAHEEHDERPFLWTQPIPRMAFVLGKMATLTVFLGIALLIALVLPATLGVGLSTLLVLWGLGLALVLVSVCGGIAIGQYASSRARGLMIGIALWFGAFALYDMVSLALAHIPFFQQVPQLWASILLINPVDAVRLTGLFGLESVPFSVPGKAAWVGIVMNGLPYWTAVITIVWTAVAVVLARRRVRQATP